MIPGRFISYLSFLGVIVHEWAHKIMCQIFGIPVQQIKYFQSDGGGFVLHDKTNKLLATTFIALAPIIINTAVAFTTGCIYAATHYLNINFTWLNVILIYVGITIGMHAFPSQQDTNTISLLCMELKKKKSYFMARALDLLFSGMRVLSIVWMDVFFAILVFLTPTIILENVSPQYHERMQISRNVNEIQDNFADFYDIIRKHSNNGLYDANDFPIVLVNVDKSTDTSSEIQNPYGTPYIATSDYSDNTVFYILTTNIPSQDCKEMLKGKWSNSLEIQSPENCSSELNSFWVKYK